MRPGVHAAGRARWRMEVHMTGTSRRELPDPTAAATSAEFADRLRVLRAWAGQPSLRRLRELGGTRIAARSGHRIDSLPESTTSYVLRGDRPAPADFVRRLSARPRDRSGRDRRAAGAMARGVDRGRGWGGTCRLAPGTGGGCAGATAAAGRRRRLHRTGRRAGRRGGAACPGRVDRDHGGDHGRGRGGEDGADGTRVPSAGRGLPGWSAVRRPPGVHSDADAGRRR